MILLTPEQKHWLSKAFAEFYSLEEAAYLIGLSKEDADQWLKEQREQNEKLLSSIACPPR